MIVGEIVEELKRTQGYKLYEPLPAESLRAYEDRLGLQFPSDYRQFLQLTNGCEVCFGHYRIFGFDSMRSIDAMRWNRNDCWKFAWDGGPDNYWCFGETAFGDQYAFSLDDLRNQKNVPVYRLGHISMAHTGPWNESFALFLDEELRRNAISPYSSRDKHAIQTIGPLDLSDHVMMVPSLLFRPVDDDGADAELQVMPARAAMIGNGDLGVQWDAGCEEQKTVARVDPYVDEQGLMRLRIVWADS